MLDHQFRRFRDPNTAESRFGGEVVKMVTELPSHYWHTNCYAGASFFRPCETPLRHKIGVDRIMWGQDYPHIEATYPYTTEALRNSFAGVDTNKVARMVGLDAGRRVRLRSRGAGAGDRAASGPRSPKSRSRSTRSRPIPDRSPHRRERKALVAARPGRWASTALDPCTTHRARQARRGE